MRKFLIIMFLVCGCNHPAPGTYAPDKSADYFSFHAVPYTCVDNFDCPNKSECMKERCISDGKIVSTNYVAKPSVQLGGMCYHFAKFHSFQTLNAYAINSGDGNDRNIELSMGSYFHCAPGATMENFITKVGLVDACLETVKTFPFAGQTCRHCNDYQLYKAGYNGWPYRCHPIQKVSSRVVMYKAKGFEGVPSSPSIVGRMEQIKSLLLSYGPLVISVAWSVEGGHIEESKYKLPKDMTVIKLECNPEPVNEYHVISVIGYDYSDKYNPHIYIQNSHSVSRYIYKINYYEWAENCSFAKGKIHYFTGVIPPSITNETPFVEFCKGEDLDLDGIKNGNDVDLDGDWTHNIEDCDKYNPYINKIKDGMCKKHFRNKPYMSSLCLSVCEFIDECGFYNEGSYLNCTYGCGG